MFGVGILDGDFPAGGRRQSDERTHFHEISPDAELAAAEGRHPANTENVRADTFDAAAHGIQHTAEILNVGFTGGVPDDGFALGLHRCHQSILCRGYRRFIEKEVQSHKFIGRNHIAPVHLHRGAQALEGQKMGIQTASADHIPPGRG